MEYKRNFSLYDAYDFLSRMMLDQESSEIKDSSDKFKSYKSTLRRAKIIVLVEQEAIEQFLQQCVAVWPY